jgi:hypothetical protein
LCINVAQLGSFPCDSGLDRNRAMLGDDQITCDELQCVPAAAADVTRPGDVKGTAQRGQHYRDDVAVRGCDGPASRCAFIMTMTARSIRPAAQARRLRAP